MRAGLGQPADRARERYLDSVPFIAITGNVPTGQFNRGAFQELYRHYQADFPSTVRTMCKKVFQPTRGDHGAAGDAAGVEDHGDRAAGAGGARRAVRHLQGGGRRGNAESEEWSANISSRCGADPEGVTKAVDMLLAPSGR